MNLILKTKIGKWTIVMLYSASYDEETKHAIINENERSRRKEL
jgi:hypothetical protein